MPHIPTFLPFLIIFAATFNFNSVIGGDTSNAKCANCDQVQAKLKQIYGCLVKKSNAKAIVESALGVNFRKYFGQHCKKEKKRTKRSAPSKVSRNWNSTEFSERLLHAGLECLAELKNQSACCEASKVPDFCLPLCGGAAKGQSPAMNISDIIYCKQFGQQILKCHYDIKVPSHMFKHFDIVACGAGTIGYLSAVFGAIPFLGPIASLTAAGIGLAAATASVLNDFVQFLPTVGPAIQKVNEDIGNFLANVGRGIVNFFG